MVLTGGDSGRVGVRRFEDRLGGGGVLVLVDPCPLGFDRPKPYELVDVV
jgi:hypothetical protein